MLNSIQCNKTLSKSEYKKTKEELIPKISKLTRNLKDAKIPVMIIFEGMDFAGKGVLINELTSAIDPRGYNVISIEEENDEEKRHPFLWRFWNHLPENGRVHIFDRSWYQKPIIGMFDNTLSDKESDNLLSDIVSFERLLTNDRMIIIKFFLTISKSEQEKRINTFTNKRETMWRVKEDEIKHHKHYNKYRKICQEVLVRTENDFAPWTIIESTDRRFASIKILKHVSYTLEQALLKAEKANDEKSSDFIPEMMPGSSILEGLDLNKKLDEKEYKERLKAVQNRLEELHNLVYEKRIPVILAFEGQDAAGKGGAIRRLTKRLDPRGYQVNPTSAPNDVEINHHYLWRFFTKMPKDGHIAIFDRTWYGRVLVERIEKLCTQNEWKRAYQEINEMEKALYDDGAVIIKFWLQIDLDEQEKRFNERMNNPEKQWKITDEDWRNRKKWNQYQIAADEMFIKTSTSHAPWVLVESNNKLYSRIKILETVADTLEKRIKNMK